MEHLPKELDKREYTLMLVPHQGQKVRSIRIPIILVKYCFIFLCLCIVVGIWIFIDYRLTVSLSNAQAAELHILRQNNGAQVTQLEELGKNVKALQADMNRLNSLDAEIRHIVNNDDTISTSRAGLLRPTSNYRGQGGLDMTFNFNDVSQVAKELGAAVTVREQSLRQLKEELLAKQARLKATPSIWPTHGEVTSRFGWRSSPWGGSSDWHPGIDIANDTGTPIVATADGEVIQSEWYGGYGKMVAINHGNGITTIYGHNSLNLVHAGQMVKKNQTIGYVGSTGYSTGPHVHYEVRVNGTAVNPANFLRN